MAGPLYRSDVKVDQEWVQGMSAQVVETGPLDSICGGKGRDYGGTAGKLSLLSSESFGVAGMSPADCLCATVPRWT